MGVVDKNDWNPISDLKDSNGVIARLPRQFSWPLVLSIAPNQSLMEEITNRLLRLWRFRRLRRLGHSLPPPLKFKLENWTIMESFKTPFEELLGQI